MVSTTPVAFEATRTLLAAVGPDSSLVAWSADDFVSIDVHFMEGITLHPTKIIPHSLTILAGEENVEADAMYVHQSSGTFFTPGVQYLSLARVIDGKLWIGEKSYATANDRLLIGDSWIDTERLALAVEQAKDVAR